MMLSPLLLSISLFFFSLAGYAQGKQNPSSDLGGAQLVSVNTKTTYKSAPKGFGNKQEFPPNSKKSAYIFKQERNTLWLKIPIPAEGTFTFLITPHSASDDYDWMLFKYSKELKQALARGTYKPLRTNNSRVDLKVNGKTGLAAAFSNLYSAAGPGKGFSKPLEVLKGDTLILVIDNVSSGRGFDFESKLGTGSADFVTNGKVTGLVTSAISKLALEATIICEEDSTGKIISQTRADKNGTYSLAIPLGKSVNITAQYQGHIFKTLDINTTAASSQLDFVLEGVSNGKKVTLYNIHFSPDKDAILPAAVPELERLINFVKSEESYDIKIIGHTNNNPFADSRYLQRLSFNRAIAVKNVLIAAGISEERIGCAGMGGKNPLTTSKIAEEALRNLRVEILLVKREN